MSSLVEWRAAHSAARPRRFAVDGTTDVMARLTPSFRTIQPRVDLAESPPITRQCLLFVGEFVVSSPLDALGQFHIEWIPVMFKRIRHGAGNSCIR
jgi:hypothetical protein